MTQHSPPKPRVLILKEHGTNCEKESKFAFELAGAQAEIIHMNDLIQDAQKLFDYQILMFPGGFSYGDDTGSGLAWANRIRNNFWEELSRYVEDDHLILGVCNGFQVLTHLGLVPATEKYGMQEVALSNNEHPRYLDTWVDLVVENRTPWLKGIHTLMLPIRHGEGRFYADPKTLATINDRGQVTLRYVEGPYASLTGELANPNGSLESIAGITDPTKRILGMMPHPEAAIDFLHLPNAGRLKRMYQNVGREVPTEGPGLQIIRNGVEYFL